MSASRQAAHLTDDRATLTAMLEDMGMQSALYRPTSYWQPYVDRTTEAILQGGLSSFRGAAAPGFKGFVYVPARPTFRPSGVRRMALQLASKVPGISRIVSGYEAMLDATQATQIEQQKRLVRLLYEYILQIDDPARIVGLEDSGLGQPLDALEVRGRVYTLAFLTFFTRYLFAAQTVDLARTNVIIELGPGYGGQAEIFLRLHPDLKYVVIDIPPMAYVTERYLGALFPGQVLGYQRTREIGSIGPDAIRDHRVIVLCPWQMPHVRFDVDLFWNAASFQEMEREVVANYLSLVEGLGTKRMLLHTESQGIEPGAGGQQAPISAAWILEQLAGRYEVVNDPAGDSARFAPYYAGSLQLYLLERSRS